MNRYSEDLYNGCIKEPLEAIEVYIKAIEVELGELNRSTPEYQPWVNELNRAWVIRDLLKQGVVLEELDEKNDLVELFISCCQRGDFRRLAI